MITPPQFPWRTVTGRDFARSIAWARKQPTLSDLIRAKLCPPRK